MQEKNCMKYWATEMEKQKTKETRSKWILENIMMRWQFNGESDKLHEQRRRKETNYDQISEGDSRWQRMKMKSNRKEIGGEKEQEQSLA